MTEKRETAIAAIHDDLGAYEARERMRLAEKELDHRASERRTEAQLRAAALEIYRDMMNRRFDMGRYGQKAALGTSMVLLVLAFVLGMTDHTTAAVAFAAIDIGGLSAVFISGRLAESRSQDPPIPLKVFAVEPVGENLGKE